MAQPDPARAAFLEAELQRIKNRMKRDWHAADYVLDELGLPPLPPMDRLFGASANGDAPQASDSGTPNPHANVMDLVNPGEFASRASTKATYLLLQKVGRERPLKLTDIYNAIKRGGVKIGSAQTLYRSLERSGLFCKPAKGLWALSEWYTPAERRRMQQSATSDPEAGLTHAESASDQEPSSATSDHTAEVA